MISLTLGNSTSTIKGLTPSQDKALREHLSYTVGGSSAFFSGYGPRKRCLLSKCGEFPTGLLSRIHCFFADNKLVWSRPLEKRFKPHSQPHHLTLDDQPYLWQDEAVEAAVRHSRGIITAPTGTGKSLAMALLVARLNVRTLIIVPSLEIKRQLQAVFDDLGVKNATIRNIDAADLDSLTDFDCLIIDEAHHVAAKTYQKLNKTAWTGIYYRFFFTATPFRNDNEEQLLFESIAGQVIYNLEYQEAVDKGYIVPVEAYYIEVPKQETDAFTYTQVYKELVVEHPRRNNLIAVLLLRLQDVNTPTLCLVREVNHGKLLSELTGIPFVHGLDEESRDYIRQFNAGEITSLIGTTGILGEGVDTKPCEFVVIAGLGKAKSQFMQQVGRSVRRFASKESAKVIIIKDKSHKFTTRHFNIQKAILKEEYGIVCQKLEL